MACPSEMLISLIFGAREEIPHTYMTHHANFALPKQGYTHWWKMFNARQLLVHTQIASSSGHIYAAKTVQAPRCRRSEPISSTFAISVCLPFGTLDGITLRRHFGNPNYAPKNNVVEVGLWTRRLRQLDFSTISSVLEGTLWAKTPWEPVIGGRGCYKERPNTSLEIQCCRELPCSVVLN